MKWIHLKTTEEGGVKMFRTQNSEVSVIIRTKNEERWIEQCLKKIFSQSYNNFEVIIIDNNSKDRTIKKAKKFPVKVIKIKKPLIIEIGFL